jgi:hypothetical protein
MVVPFAALRGFLFVVCGKRIRDCKPRAAENAKRRKGTFSITRTIPARARARSPARAISLLGSLLALAAKTS